MPREHLGRFWRDADDAQLISYIDLIYGTFSMCNYNNSFETAMLIVPVPPIKNIFIFPHFCAAFSRLAFCRQSAPGQNRVIVM
ncbi:hypothetical protein D3Z60_12015 [Lachnospiraceae bacterium]|nr:hypothetical protein [Lachnospiraceae bacterium]